MIYILTIWLNASGGTITTYTQVLDYANKIGVTRTMTKAECESKIPKLKKYVAKNKLGQLSAYCRLDYK